MANSTRGDLRSQITGHQFSEVQYATFANQMLNEAQTDLAGQIDFRELFDTETITTTSGDNSYTLPTDFMRNHSLRDTDEILTLSYLSTDDFDLLDPTNTGRPFSYTIDGGQVKLYPTPDAVYTLALRHYRGPASLSDDADSSEIPRSDKCLRYYTLARCFERENDVNQSQLHEANYEREKARLAGWAQNDANDADTPSQVQGMWSGGREYPLVRMP